MDGYGSEEARRNTLSKWCPTLMPTPVNRSELGRNRTAKWLRTRVLSAGSRRVPWGSWHGVRAGHEPHDQKTPETRVVVRMCRGRTAENRKVLGLTVVHGIETLAVAPSPLGDSS